MCVFFGKMSIQVLCLFLNQIGLFLLLLLLLLFLLSCVNSLYILDINPLSDICKYFLPFHKLPFHFVDGFLCCAKNFSLMLSLLYIFAFVAFAFGVRSKKFIVKTNGKELIPYVFF